MKKTVKIISALAMIALLLCVTLPTFATGSTFQPNQVQYDTNNTNNIKETGYKIVGIIQIVGVIASVGVLVVLGIKYMMGSAEEKAEYKKTLFPYIIGAVFIFAASALAQTIYTWAQGI